MAYEARVLADSISNNDDRLTSLEVTLPRIMLAELNTHRVFSRNSASSRAIPTRKQLKMVMEEPFVPDIFGRNQPGMEPDIEKPLNIGEITQAGEAWLDARDNMMSSALQLYLGRSAFQAACIEFYGSLENEADTIEERRQVLRSVIDNLPQDLDKEFAEKIGVNVLDLLNIHKQYPNRLLEPFMWHKVIITSTEWDNFFALRANPAAQREIRLAAETMYDAIESSDPKPAYDIRFDDYKETWHMPLVRDEDFETAAEIKKANESSLEVLIKVAVARCARVSYLTHDGIRDLEKDVDMYERLLSEGHMSPFEHVARAKRPHELSQSQWSGNFRGWHQHRKDIPNENNFAKVLG